jgi:HTH-type transcriptional regulator, sugar sensing transcriptional regulator
MDTEILGQIGLSKNEIKVYFALLELDQASATPIIKKAGIPHSKVYPIIDKLMRKGLVSYIIRNNVKYFQASNPANLISFINEKQKLLKTQKAELEKIIPQIELKRKLVAEQQEAAIYEGESGVKAAFQLILDNTKSGKEYLVFSLGEELRSRPLRRFYAAFHRKRLKRNITVRLMANKKLKEIFLRYHQYKDFKVKYTSLNLPTGIFIFENRVMTVVWGEKPTAFVITSKNNMRAYAAFFEEMWKKQA